MLSLIGTHELTFYTFCLAPLNCENTVPAGPSDL